MFRGFLFALWGGILGYVLGLMLHIESFGMRLYSLMAYMLLMPFTFFASWAFHLFVIKVNYGNLAEYRKVRPLLSRRTVFPSMILTALVELLYFAFFNYGIENSVDYGASQLFTRTTSMPFFGEVDNRLLFWVMGCMFTGYFTGAAFGRYEQLSPQEGNVNLQATVLNTVVTSISIIVTLAAIIFAILTLMK